MNSTTNKAHSKRKLFSTLGLDLGLRSAGYLSAMKQKKRQTVFSALEAHLKAYCEYANTANKLFFLLGIKHFTTVCQTSSAPLSITIDACHKKSVVGFFFATDL